MDNKLQCPVDFVLINENKTRLVAFFVLVLTIAFLIAGSWSIIAFLTADFFLRVNNWGKYSLLSILSDVVIKQMNIKNKPTDRAPKRFAVGVGLVFTAVILVLILANQNAFAVITAIVLALFAFLEAFIAFCAGCHVYTFLNNASDWLKRIK